MNKLVRLYVLEMIKKLCKIFVAVMSFVVPRQRRLLETSAYKLVVLPNCLTNFCLTLPSSDMFSDMCMHANCGCGCVLDFT